MSPRFRFSVLVGVVLLSVSTAQAQYTQHAKYSQYMPEPRDPSNLKEIQPRSRKSSLEFQGNLVVDDARIRSAAHLSTQSKMNEALATEAARAVETFYHDSGFALARVLATHEEKGWALSIDEGVLYSVSVYGAGWRDTFLLSEKLLPFGVFHVPTLQKGLSHWLEQHPGYTVRYELSERPVSTEKRINRTNPVNRLFSPSQNLVEMQDSSRTNLLVYIDRSKKKAQVDLGFAYSSANKLEFKLNYDKGSQFVEDDWLAMDVMVGLARRSTIDPDSSGSQYYSNAAFNTHWFSPSFLTSWLRFVPAVGISNRNEQRPDLPLDRYRLLETFGDVGLASEWGRHQYVYLMAGYDLKYIHGIDAIPSDPFTVNTNGVHGLRVRSGLNMMLSKPRENRLLNDSVQAEVAWHRRGSNGQIVQITANFQKVFFTGPAFYILSAEGVWKGGDVQFFEETSPIDLGMSASFGREFWVRRGVNARGEARFNLWGSDIQLGVFVDAAPFGLIDHTTNQQNFVFAVDAGPIAYITLAKAFQLSLGFASGFATTGDRSYDLMLGFSKIF